MKTRLTLLCVCVVAQFAIAGQETQTFDQDWELGQEPTQMVFQSFDSMDGARTLTSITAGFAGDMAADLIIENYTPGELAPGDWFLNAYQQAYFVFNETDQFPNGGPFYVLGEIGKTGITGTLSPGSGGPFGGIPGDVVVNESISGSVDGAVNSTEFLSYFTDSAPLVSQASPFSDFVFSLPNADDFVDVRTTMATQVGTFTLTYEFDLLCDLNADDVCDVGDLDVLVNSIANGGNEDLTADGMSDLADRDRWLESAARVNGFGEPYLVGDANLDGTVDSRDLNVVGIQWRQDATTWSQGDFDASGFVDESDLNGLGINWNRTVPQPAAMAVPEAAGGVHMAFVAVMLCWLRKRRG